MQKLREVERDKYVACWEMADYNVVSHGEDWSDAFGEIVKPKAGQTVLDCGCGWGRGGRSLEKKYGLAPSFLDFENYNDLEPFIAQPLWQKIEVPNGKYDYGLCCDVLEHVPEEFSMLAFRNILDACDHVFLSVCFLPDAPVHQYAGKPLHLTVHPFPWWLEKMREVCEVIDARDLVGEGIFYVKG
jgi:hypothetical protein